MSRPLNLATRPFRNQTLPAILRGLALLALLVLSVQHALVVRRLLPGKDSALHRQASALEKELQELRREASGLRVPLPDSAVVGQWLLVKDLVDRRTFSWSGLFSRLEEVLPPGMRLLSISPSVREGELRLKLAAEVEAADEGFDFVRVLEERSEFEGVYPVSAGESAQGKSEFNYSMKYIPSAAPTASGPTPAAEKEEAGEAVKAFFAAEGFLRPPSRDCPSPPRGGADVLGLAGARASLAARRLNEDQARSEDAHDTGGGP